MDGNPYRHRLHHFSIITGTTFEEITDSEKMRELLEYESRQSIDALPDQRLMCLFTEEGTRAGQTWERRVEDLSTAYNECDAQLTMNCMLVGTGPSIEATGECWRNLGRFRVFNYSREPVCVYTPEAIEQACIPPGLLNPKQFGHVWKSQQRTGLDDPYWAVVIFPSALSTRQIYKGRITNQLIRKALHAGADASFRISAFSRSL